MSRVLSLRLREEQMERLRRLARRLGRSPSETGARLIEEALRMAEFGHIEFRDSPAGRQAYVRGTSLAVWEVVSVAQAYENDAAPTARHLTWPLVRVRAALQYAAAFPEDINAALEDNDAYDLLRLSRMLPQVEVFVVGDDETNGTTAGGTGDTSGAERRAAPATG